jgi:hypothetical protein
MSGGSNIGETVIYLLAGMKAKLTAPVRTVFGEGWFPSRDSQVVAGEVRSDIYNGFIVENTNIGTISTDGVEGEVGVIYHHKRALENKIWFFADTGEVAVCVISSVPIHDHSSVVQGGPAYGTYFSDDVADQNST